MNLFEFYRDVALRYQEEHLGIRMSSERHRVLLDKLYEVQTSYFGFDPPEYTDPDILVAYTLHFAPKHAVIWRCIGQRLNFEDDGADWALNSIGTGPGSEVFGLVCALPPSSNIGVSVVGLERQDAWRDVFEIARDEYRLRTGTPLNALLTNTPTELAPDGQVIGSLVLSEAMKRGDVVKLIEGIRANTTSNETWFLDYNYPIQISENVKEFVDAPLKRAGFRCNFSGLKDDLALSEAIRSEMDACDPLYCRRQIKDSQPLTLYTINLR